MAERNFCSIVLAEDEEGCSLHHKKSPGEIWFNHPVKLLGEIRQDRDILHSVRYITYVCGDEYSAMDFTTLQTSHIDDETWDIIRSLESAGGQQFLRDILQDSPLLKHQELFQRCLDGMSAGKESCAFAILLFSLPELQRLRFSQPCWDEELLSTIFTDPIYSSKLTTVESYHSDTEDEDAYADLAIFALAPTVRTLKGRSIGYSDTIESIPKWNEIASGLQVLELTSCTMLDEDIERLLSPLSSLRELRFCQNKNLLIDPPFQPQVWVDVLAGSKVSDSLEVLSLSCPNGPTSAVKSFKGFKALRKLEIDTRSLITDEEDGSSLESIDALEEGFHRPSEKTEEELAPRLVDKLPASIENVQLLGGTDDDISLLLRDIVSEKHRLPKLRKLTYGQHEMDMVIKDQLESVGISVIQKDCYEIPEHADFWQKDQPIYHDWCRKGI